MYMTMKESDDRMDIDESTITDAGKGVFAKKKIKKGSTLLIVGPTVEVSSEADKCTRYAQKYKFATSEKQQLFVIPIGYAAVINHAPSSELQNVEIRYMPFGNPIYYFIKDVEPDEEILGNYGENWDKILSWAAAKAESVKDEWETFLEYDVYNLGRLKEIL